MDVTIYIDIYHTGHLKKGTGTYTIVLEYIAPDGKPRTREYIEGLENTTKNRTAIKACITALSYLIKTCIVKIIINSNFVVNSVNQHWDKTKNADLWQQLYQALSQHKVTFEYSLTNPYSTYMFTQLRRAKISFEEDISNHETEKDSKNSGMAAVMRKGR